MRKGKSRTQTAGRDFMKSKIKYHPRRRYDRAQYDGNLLGEED